VWLGTWGKGIYKSYDGMDFDIMANGTDMKMYGKHITQIVIDPNPPNAVYVATEEGVYQSRDGGQNWIETNQGLASTDVRVLHINSNGELYAGTKGYGLYKWEQGVWQAINSFGKWGCLWPIWDNRVMYPYTSLLIHSEDNSKILLGSFPQGIFKSTDGGTTWRESNIGWTNDGVFCLVHHPQDPEIVYSGTYNGVNKSLDFGEHWEICDEGWPDEQWVYAIDFDFTNPDIMYACSKNGENEGTGRDGFHGTVMKSIDRGAHWFEITNGLDVNQEFYALIVDHFNPNTIYIAAQWDGMFISRDGGNSWNSWNEGLTNHVPATNANNVTNTMVISADHSILYFGSWGSGVFRRMITPVLPVNNLSADLRHHQVILKWQFDDLNNNFSHYNIYKSTEEFTSIEGMSPYGSISSASATTFEDMYVEPGVQYYYAVTTNDESGYENDHIYVLGPVVLTGEEPAIEPGENCDFSGEGTVSINDVIAFLLLARDNPEHSRLDWNGDGIYSIIDAVALLLDIIQGKCTGGTTLLAAADSLDSAPMAEKLSQSDIEYIEEAITLMNLTDEQMTLIYQALYGKSRESSLPKSFSLSQNYPNPFNPLTTISYDVPSGKPVHVSLKVYDIRGRLIHTLADGIREPGVYKVFWDGSTKRGGKVSSGVYFYRMQAGEFVQTRKMVLLK